ncbi:UNVERIFIED_CONTAM: Small nuclear ribonucleoprotein-associated protein B [Sesamum latifolium]|uniref:Small nuclear ribonucleoprotein-associated protein B n=1 Tax=Sesamum latifolium TaxID=2727402 RepID=A0AAW2SNG6_9LAMI
MSMSKSSKMLQYINYRMRVTIQDGRQLIGKFNRHMKMPGLRLRRLPPSCSANFRLLRAPRRTRRPPHARPRPPQRRRSPAGPCRARSWSRWARSRYDAAPDFSAASDFRSTGFLPSPAAGCKAACYGSAAGGFPPRPGMPMPPPPQFRPGMPPPGGFAPPPQFAQRPQMVPPPQMMRGPPPPGGPPRPGMPGVPPPGQQPRDPCHLRRVDRLRYLVRQTRNATSTESAVVVITLS